MGASVPDGTGSAAEVESSMTERGLSETATELLRGYEQRGGCILARAGYLDLLGRAWGCTVVSGGRVETCLVREDGRTGGCVVSVIEMDEGAWSESYEQSRDD